MRSGRGAAAAAQSALVVVVAVALLGSCTTMAPRGARRLARPPRSQGAALATSRAQPSTSAPGDDVDGADDRAPLSVVDADVSVAFAVDAPGGGAPLAVTLGARLTKAAGVRGPGVVLVPGGGDVSRDGRRKGDGVVAYATPVDVTRAWARALAARGAVVLAYDKRTCGSNDDPLCATNPQADVDARGPVALARDVDAACERLRLDPDFDGRLVLFAHGQAAQVALSSTCAQTADALVLLSPIPRAIDAVLVDALLERQAVAAAAGRDAPPEARATSAAEAARLKNLAGSRAASFASMKDGRFSPDARVDGATIAFWLGWMKLTADTPALVDAARSRVIVVVGGGDQQLSRADRAAAAALPGRARVVVDDADHHLLVGEQLAPVVVEPVLSALDDVLATPGT